VPYLKTHSILQSHRAIVSSERSFDTGLRNAYGITASPMGQERRIGAVRNISALPPRADVGADIVEPPVSATSRPEQVQQILEAKPAGDRAVLARAPSATSARYG
jgi:hypothetical protein